MLLYLELALHRNQCSTQCSILCITWPMTTTTDLSSYDSKPTWCTGINDDDCFKSQDMSTGVLTSPPLPPVIIIIKTSHSRHRKLTSSSAVAFRRCCNGHVSSHRRAAPADWYPYMRTLVRCPVVRDKTFAPKCTNGTDYCRFGSYYMGNFCFARQNVTSRYLCFRFQKSFGRQKFCATATEISFTFHRFTVSISFEKPYGCDLVKRFS